jgi:hypothetical protein
MRGRRIAWLQDVVSQDCGIAAISQCGKGLQIMVKHSFRTGRKPKPDVVYFQRKLGDAERAILLAAGQGDTSIGFMEVLDAYRYFYNLGLRPGMNLNSMKIVASGDVRPREVSSEVVWDGNTAASIARRHISREAFAQEVEQAQPGRRWVAAKRRAVRIGIAAGVAASKPDESII